MNSQLQLIDEHLEFIYLVESLDFNKIKSNMDKIKDAFESKNILKVNRAFTFLPDITAGQLRAIVQKKFGPAYVKSEKYVKTRLKKGPDIIVDLMAVTHAAATIARDKVKDEDISNKINEFLDRLDEALRAASKKVSTDGMLLIGIAVLIGFFFEAAALVSLLGLVGIVFIAAAIIFYVLAILCRLFIKAKQAKQKVIK